MNDSQAASIHDHPGVARVRAALLSAGVKASIAVMPEAAHTAEAAARALGCDVGEIAKSIIFRADNGETVLVITSGRNRVDRAKVSSLVQQGIGKADADFVRARTGFAIGGVAPLAHTHAPVCLMDEDLLRYPGVWPAAGHPNTMFCVDPRILAEITHARIADIAERERKPA